MSKKTKGRGKAQPKIDVLDDHSTPDWPTAVKLRYSDGRVQGVKGGVWLYKKVPLGPMVDARSNEEALEVGNGMARAFNELAATSQYTIKRRSTSRSSYREVHLLLVNLRRLYSPPANSRIKDYLRESFGDEIVQDRLLLFGVKLRDEVGGVDRTWRDVVDSAALSLMTAEVPISDYDRDFHEVDDMLSRAGFETPTAKDFELAESWWTAGESPEAPMVNHADHIHIFRSVAGANVAADSGVGDCKNWPKRIAGHNIVRMASIHGFDLNFVSNTNPITQWAASLLRKRAVAVSVRGKVEPSPITRAELRRQRKRYIEDIRDRRAQGQMSDQEQEEMLAGLTSVEGAYASGQAPPTIVETSVVAAFSGPGTENLETLGNGTAFKVSPMSFRQQYALPETWIASPVRSNPNLMDLPSTTLSYASFQDLAVVGDGVGAQIGFTVSDRQSAFMSSTKSADEDSTPIAIAVGSPGSGKTQLMAFAGHQYSLEGRPVIVIDPKPGSDLRESFKNPSVFSLDELVGDGSGTEGGSGVLDPLRFSVTPADGINTAVSLLNFVNVWPRGVSQNFEADLKYALAYGVQHDKKSIGTALQKALDDGIATEELVEPILKQSRTDPLFGTLVGLHDEGETLRASQGLTYIRVGNAGLKLPAQGVDQSSTGLIERTSAGIVRMMVFGSAEALRGRRGVLMLDEAWVFLGAGAQEVDELGRLARSLELLPWLFTQKVREIVDAKIESYISRGIILHTRDPKEAEAAFKIFNVDPTQERRRFTTAMDQSGRKPITQTLPDGSRRVVRGSIGLYCDMDERAVDIEIKIPQSFLEKSSTNALDRARRENRQVI